MQYCDAAPLPGVFTPIECQDILSRCTNFERATVGGYEVNPIRTNSGDWLKPSKMNKWIFDRIADRVFEVNAKLYGFDIQKMDQINVLRYEVDQAYHGHYDNNSEATAHRKLTVVVQLSEGTDYEGGLLEICGNPVPSYYSRKLGDGMLFPSYLYHAAHPITRGTRYALACWLGGPPFR